MDLPAHKGPRVEQLIKAAGAELRSDFFKKAGYKFKKAKKTLTSCDPDFREKLKLIKNTLSGLAVDEKFFSIDEFGPFSVKIRGGRALVPGDVVRTFPQNQISKGRVICTAALELSTNQMTYFYSAKKNSWEMIKLITQLAEKYKREKRIFISWDSASWHASKAVFKKVAELNSEQFRCTNLSPLIELRPLPTGAQFLNVIEFVFSGMSRAILHNSDYQSVDECLPIRLTQTPTRASVGRHGRDGHPRARRSGFSPVAP